MAHLREPGNGRITIMFCGFESPARIMRLFGRGTSPVCPFRRSLTFVGRAIEFGTPEYDEYLPPDVRHPGSRCAVVIDIHKVGTVRIVNQVSATAISLHHQSCGYGVPLYQFVAHRPTLYNWCAGLETAEREYSAKSDAADSGWSVAEKGLKAYWIKENLKSIDGLPAMKAAHTTTTTPVHAPSRGEWGKDSQAFHSSEQNGVRNDIGAAVTQVQTSRSPIGDWNSTELLKFAVAFSLGAIITAVYIQSLGGPC